ncbi:MAG: transcription-repair coupling factor [Planctomycetes bacterium]|nr:transcription-repair coupling factor [Planctomycetota bacterium]
MSAPALPRPDIAPALLAVARGERASAVVSEVHGSAATWFLAALASATDARLLVVTARASDAKDLELDWPLLAPGIAMARLPEVERFEAGTPEARRNKSEREKALAQLREPGGARVVLASLAALADAAGDPAAPRSERLLLKARQRIDREELRRRLYGSGLEPAPLVSAPGEVSFRGDIVDFFPYGAERPTRVELFDDEIESLRAFDPETQRSTGELLEVELIGAPTTTRLVQQSEAAGVRRFTALDHFTAPPLCVRIDPVAHEIAVAKVAEEQPARAGEWQQAAARLQALPRIDLHPELHAGSDSVLGARPIEGAGGIHELGRFCERLHEALDKLVIWSATAAEGRRITTLLRAHLPASPRRAVIDARGGLAAGFWCAAAGLWAGNHHELLGRTRLQRVSELRATAARPIREMLELTPGEFVVHQTHGVALFRGMKEMKQEGGTEDYLELEFDEATLLYVPASKVDLVSRYIGAGGSAPKLDKVGGKSWARKKADVEDALDDMSEELLELQAQRKTRPGHPFAVDDEMQAEFDASFPYADTLDQVAASEEIKRDMQQPRAMDRLLCGDVGFGKTEVAIRAVFKAATQGKQVAVLAPTTLLVRQHAETFKNRMADWPVRVEALSRLTPPKKSREVIEGLRQGHVDVAVGSHRLLSAKISFKDLGLLVIDEEQRFGVKHKEALKKLKTTVDVLTLSATPIPRTLHMALVGLRDISTLREPPRGRQPVETRVTYEDDELVRHAIERELAREGQVIYLFNRVGPIYDVAAKVKRLVPAARVGVAHGQMPGNKLEQMALSFAAREIDVLVCTTIIEAGIDIPTVNTLVVDRADLMGLADLHQLRGRIGRSDRKAYALFFIPKKPLPAIALKRLRALEGLSHLGAGFDIAIRDLEIRGAGNLLGKEQSGHIASIGYDLYCRMLAKSIAKRRGQKLPAEPEEIDIGIGLPAFLPREYIRSTHQRMELLRRLGESRSPEAVAQLQAEMRDRFGRPPAPVQHLIDVFQLKEHCRRLGIARVFHTGGGEVLLFVRDYARFHKLRLRRGEGRHVEGSRVLVVLPPEVRTPEELLRYLLEEFRERPAPPPPRPLGDRKP